MDNEIKSTMRRGLREVRSKDIVTPIQSSQLVDRLTQVSDCYDASVLSFISFDGEPDLMGLHENRPDNIFYPVIGASPGAMKFFKWQIGEPLTTNRFGIQEPSQREEFSWKRNPTSIILIPALAVDLNGYRLGYGGGYYDRFLSRIPSQNKMIKIAVVFDRYLVESIPTEDHDVGVDFIVTEKQVLVL